MTLFRALRDAAIRPPIAVIQIQPQNNNRPVSPMSFPAIRELASSVDGMMTVSAMSIMDSLLSFQEMHDITGHVIEFGVYKGRSAAVLAGHAIAPERLILVDVADCLDRAALAQVRAPAEYVLCPSEKFRSLYRGWKSLRGKCRFIHIDTSHYYRATLSEMRLAELLIQDRGILALDDFTNLHYSQVAAAVHRYLCTARTKLSIFLLTNEKAFLCKQRDFDFYCSFVLEGIGKEIEARGLGKICLARTEIDPDYRPVYLRPARDSDDGPVYGADLFGHYYAKP